MVRVMLDKNLTGKLSRYEVTLQNQLEPDHPGAPHSASSAILDIAHSSIEASCHVRALAMPVTMSFRSRLAVALLGAALTPPS